MVIPPGVQSTSSDNDVNTNAHKLMEGIVGSNYLHSPPSAAAESHHLPSYPRSRDVTTSSSHVCMPVDALVLQRQAGRQAGRTWRESGVSSV